MSKIIEGNQLIEPFDKTWPLWPRPYHTHIASQHIERLGYLIEAEDTQQAADSSDAFVLGRRPSRSTQFRVVAHRTEFINNECFSV